LYSEWPAREPSATRAFRAQVAPIFGARRPRNEARSRASLGASQRSRRDTGETHAAMVNAAKLEQGQIQDRMPVVGSDGRSVGTVDSVEGDWIKLAKNDPQSDGEEHRYVPLSTVAGLDGGMVRLSMPAAQMPQAMETEASMARKRALRLEEGTGPGQVEPDGPHGSRGAKHGGPKGQREHGMSGQAPGPPGQTSFGVHRPVDGDPGPDGQARRPTPTR
jgi:hypothetical protein